MPRTTCTVYVPRGRVTESNERHCPNLEFARINSNGVFSGTIHSGNGSVARCVRYCTFSQKHAFQTVELQCSHVLREFYFGYEVDCSRHVLHWLQCQYATCMEKTILIFLLQLSFPLTLHRNSAFQLWTPYILSLTSMHAQQPPQIPLNTCALPRS